MFGIARTTGTPGASRLSMKEVGTDAATDRTSCRRETRRRTSASTSSIAWGFTARTMIEAPRTACSLRSEVPIANFSSS